MLVSKIPIRGNKIVLKRFFADFHHKLEKQQSYMKLFTKRGKISRVVDPVPEFESGFRIRNWTLNPDLGSGTGL
jgi:hypothetical protein